MSEWLLSALVHTCANVLTCRNYDEAIKVMQRATAVPKKTSISFHDDVSVHNPG